jgi:hypothetical protein
MLAASHWSHSEWKHEDARRFQFTLGFSVALHAALLLAWKLPPPVWKVADHAVLTVVLRGAATAIPVSPKAAEPERDVAVLVQKEATPAIFSVPPKPAVQAPAVPAVSRSPLPLAGPGGRIAAQASPGRISNAPSAPVGISVLLVTGDDGRVNQIYWNKLPALTDEQLRRVERAIRAKTYASGQTISEVFDVREFLKLPPGPTEEGPPTPATEPSN